MITKGQYLEAKKIVDGYKLQLKNSRTTKSKPKPKIKEGESFFEKWDKVIKSL